MPAMKILFLLLAAHYIIDIQLQNETIARQKNLNAPPPKAYDPAIHGPLEKCWPYYMACHAFSHGLGVFMATGGSVYFAFAETIAHYIIDVGKCSKLYGIHADQAMHVITKFVWFFLITQGIW